MKLYNYGCTCGRNRAKISRLVARTGAEVINTRKQGIEEHISYLKQLGVEDRLYPPVIVDGDTVTLLSKWDG